MLEIARWRERIKIKIVRIKRIIKNNDYKGLIHIVMKSEAPILQ